MQQGDFYVLLQVEAAEREPSPGAPDYLLRVLSYAVIELDHSLM
jgi:hypothetical protein